MVNIIIYKICTFVIMMLIGAIGAKAKIIPKSNLPAISNLLVKIIFPCLGFSLIYEANISLADFLNKQNFILAELILSGSLLVLGALTSRLFRLPAGVKQVHIVHTMFGNQGFINIPILLALYTAGEANVYIAIFNFIDQTLLWSLGVVILSSSDPNEKGFSPSTLRKIINPMTVSMILALVLTSLSVPLPSALSDTITTIGSTAFSLAMIFLGATLAYINIKEKVYAYDYLFFVVVKMVLIPILVRLVTRALLPDIESTILTLFAAMPGMSGVPMMAANYHSDSEFASKVVFVMTIASAFTIPLVFLI